jgi:two-component system, cell cycle sensor histidine kinase and response regulator CckA
MTSKKVLDILLVEDSPTDRLMAMEAFKSAEVLTRVNCAENGEEAMAYLRREGKYRDAKRPDLILLDLNMPKKDGREVLEELKKDPVLKYIPVVVLTTSAAEEDVLKAYGDHANSYITKPVDFPSFSEAIAALGVYWLRTVTLPPEVQAPVESRPKRATDSVELERILRVLLLEDNPVDVLLLKDALRSSTVGKFVVSHAARVSQLRPCLEKDNFDVVITDLGLPDGQGLGTYRQVRALAPGLPVIVLTGDVDEKAGLRCLREGAQDYLVKGQLTGDALARAIRYSIDKKSIEDQLRQSQRMEAVGQLAGGLAHDFNNLLTVIQGQATLLESGLLSTEETKEASLEILDASARAVTLTRQLLTFSRRQKIHLKTHNLNEIVGNFAKIIQRLIGEAIELELTLCRDTLPIRADSGMLEQILLNLAINARDAMPSGGKLILQTSVEELGLAEAESDYRRRFARLIVSDNGCGISPANLERIFDPFFTTKDVGKGTGLGLATAYSIVQQHGGRIEVCSELGVGTGFEILIPITEMELKADSPRTTLKSAEREASETILVVDDEDALRKLVRRSLEKRKYRVLEAGSGPEAKDVFAKHGDEIDLLFTDMKMPGGMTGRQLGQELSALNPDLLVIYTSGYSTDFGREDFPLEQGVNFLQKPFEVAVFLKLVRSRLDEAKK